MKLKQKELQHFFWRAGFYESFPLILETKEISKQDLFEKQLSLSLTPTNPLAYTGVFSTMRSVQKLRNYSISEYRKLARAERRSQNIDWVKQLINSKSQLRQKMNVFWHDHFPCKVNNPLFMNNYLETIKKHSLGNFRDLLFSISKEPAMLAYLNLQQSTKDNPNENFAREVMELFTLGVGNYTESDIKEAARAFTGWGYSMQSGQFEFKKNNHDYGIKKVFESQSNLNGDDVLELLLSKKQTAYYITTKIYQYFVNEKINYDRIKQLGDAFYKSDYNIEELIRLIFTSDWFYDSENIGTRIKSPIELIVGSARALGINPNSDSLTYFQNILGQNLLNPPNVSGWPSGRLWIDSSSMAIRTNLVRILIEGADTPLKERDSFDMNEENESGVNYIQKQFDVALYSEQIKNCNINQQTFIEYLLQVDCNSQLSSVDIKSELGLTKLIKDITALPEYQLC